MPLVSMHTTIAVRVRDGEQSGLVDIPVVAVWMPSVAQQALAWGTASRPPWYIITTNDDGFWDGTASPPAILDDWPDVLKPGQVAVNADLADPAGWAGLLHCMRDVTQGWRIYGLTR